MTEQGSLFDQVPTCPRCLKPMPNEWCWDGCRTAGECPLGYFARDIAESPRAVRELHERAHARTTDPITSHEAAASIAEEKIRLSQEHVLACLKRYGPMHDQRLIERYVYYAKLDSTIPTQSESGIRTRRKELVSKGRVEDTGQKVVLDSGRKSIVWRAI